MRRIVGAVLAAGSGVRMGAPKAELVVDGARLVDRAVAALSGGGCAAVLAVTRRDVAVGGAQVVVNPLPEQGMRSSLALAVDAGAALGADALAVLLVDTPGVSADALRAVVSAWTPGRIVVGSYGGRRGHPTVMGLELWRVALELAGPDEGARALLASRPDLVDEVAVPGDPSDLDTPADLSRWQAWADISIRAAAASDLAALREIFGRAAVSNSADRLALQARPDLLIFDEAALLDGRIRVAIGPDVHAVGFASTVIRGEVAELDALFVDPAWTRRGIGRRLVEDAIALARHWDITRIEVTANPAAVAFYAGLGFVCDGTVETELGQAETMHRNLLTTDPH